MRTRLPALSKCIAERPDWSWTQSHEHAMYPSSLLDGSLLYTTCQYDVMGMQSAGIIFPPEESRCGSRDVAHNGTTQNSAFDCRHEIKQMMKFPFGLDVAVIKPTFSNHFSAQLISTTRLEPNRTCHAFWPSRLNGARPPRALENLECWCRVGAGIRFLV